MKSLVIVESGAKAKKIKGYLDSNFPNQDWQVEACVGHVRDLPDNENAVNTNDWNNLKWEFSTKGKKVMKHPQWVVEIVTKYHQVSMKEANEYLEIYYSSEQGKAELKSILQKFGTEPKEVKKLNLP